MKFAIIGCSKSKLSVPCPAKDLYQGDLFKLARRYVESLGIPYRILSAKHGLIHPDAFVEPYDIGIVDLSKPERVDIGYLVESQIRWNFPSRLDPITVDMQRFTEVLFLAGRAYLTLLPNDMHSRYKIECPLLSLGIGQQKHWLRVNTKEAA